MITLTDTAKKHVCRYLTKRSKGIGIRIGVKTTGCSGLAYTLEYIDDLMSVDEVSDVIFDQTDFIVVTDKKSLQYIDRMQVDFVREGLNEGFRFSNPNERDRCGCGESFRV